ncbi:hypothetical protein K504DRAFT_463802 [Pleomassaria siparia CBS 279.74]|uniref:Uncharacterized protein n=1 Tax=Pleomassaria siparia CBS 279.74 TaxID=1314801 RepID=A0A6G1JRD2_9PLEO|nr:hypothetical protein K504DRAFT_463802 [Pleomassaria siparia CBS 279.74]
MEARNNESALNTKTGRVDAGAWSLPASAPINELPPQPYAKMSRKDSLNAETEKANIRPIRRPAPAPAPAPVPMSELDAKLARRKAALDAAEAEREDADTERSY